MDSIERWSITFFTIAEGRDEKETFVWILVPSSCDSYVVFLPRGVSLDGIRPVTTAVESSGLPDSICLSAVNSSIALNQFRSLSPSTEPSRRKISRARAAISSLVNGSIVGVGLNDGEGIFCNSFLWHL
jgi:hypothetical protein